MALLRLSFSLSSAFSGHDIIRASFTGSQMPLSLSLSACYCPDLLLRETKLLPRSNLPRLRRQLLFSQRLCNNPRKDHWVLLWSHASLWTNQGGRVFWGFFLFVCFFLTHCSGGVGYVIDYHVRTMEEAILGKCEITNTHSLRITPVSDVDGI